MNRAAVYAHFDDHDAVQPYVVSHMAALAKCSSRVVFVSTSQLAEPELAKIRPFCSDVWLRPNMGLDFASWRLALDRVNLGELDELVLANSSVMGPVYPLEPIFDRMSATPCDFWAMTDSHEHRWHLQSYFLVFKRAALQSAAFACFWSSVLPYRNKEQVIQSYELGLSTFLVEQGLVAASFVPTASWANKGARLWMNLRRRWNPTLFHPDQLLARGMPFVKVALLRDNPGRVPLNKVRAALSGAGDLLSQSGGDSR